MDAITTPGLRTPRRRYMSKSQRACDFCRSRKSACRIEACPPCRLCRSHGRMCTFDQPAPRRRNGSRSHPVQVHSQDAPLVEVPEMEMDAGASDDLSQWIMNIDASIDFGPFEAFNAPGQTNGVEGALDSDAVLNSLGIAGGVEGDPRESHAFAGASPGSLSDLATSRTDEMSGGLADACARSQLCGLTGDMDPYLLSRYRYDPDTNSMVFKRLAVQSVCDGPLPTQFLVQLQTESKDATDVEAQRNELNSIVSPEVGSRLIDLFYRFVFPQIPIFLANVQPNAAESPLHLLAAIYLVAMEFSSFDDVLCIQTVYEESPCDRLMKMATDEIEKAARSPTIAHLQSTLLLMLAQPRNPVMPDTCERWSLVGTAVTMAQELGLHYDPEGWHLREDEINLRRRLSWVVRYVDVWLAATLGRVPLISRRNWLVQPLQQSDFSADKPERNAARTFVPMADLTLILADVLEALYSLDAVQNQNLDFRLTLRTAQPLMTDLSRWYGKTDMSKEDPDAATEWAQLGVLHLGYHVVKMWILRATMRPFHCIRQSAAPPFSDSDSASASEAWNHVRMAAERSVAAFASFTAELDSLQLHAFWPFWSGIAWSSVGQMCTTLLLTAGDGAEAERGKQTMNRVRRILRLQSKSLAILRFSLLRLDSMHWKGFAACFELSPQVREVLHAPEV